MTQRETDLGSTLIAGSPALRGGPQDADREFAALLRQRAGSAWETLYERHFDRIFRYALARLGDRALAEDVAASTFQRALGAIDRYSYRRKPVIAWLYGIARNVVKEEARAQRSGRAGGFFAPWRRTGDGTAARAGLPELSISDTSDASDHRIDLANGLASLTEAQREVILLRYITGLSAAETARIMNRPETAIYALQSRALNSLRRRLQQNS